MARSLKRFRLLILSLTVTSFFAGTALVVNPKFPSDLPFMLLTDVVTFLFYLFFTFGPKRKRQNRRWRMLFRSVLGFLTIYGPVKALRECSYTTHRDYLKERPGIHTYERIGCNRDDFNDRNEAGSMLSIFRLFRARCIITLTVCALIVVEMFRYGWSDEASGLPQDDASVEKLRNEVELEDVSVNDNMARSIRWFRFLIISLTATSFIIGMTLVVNPKFPNDMPFLLLTEVATVIIYLKFTLISKKRRQNRRRRILLRVVLAFLTIYGPLKFLSECRYRVYRDFNQPNPGFHMEDWIGCNRDDLRDGNDEGSKLFTFRLFRARCIIMLTVCALIVVEMFLYGWSDEALGRPQDDASAEETPRRDVELGEMSVDDTEPQKMVLPEPPQAAALIK
ncbi:hypothetical protein BGZ72_009161 [Mortierella alpina]|nr:hypothetical protein BGZ72_009161 [Mortierella alpina]